MLRPRLFISQDALDAWVTAARAELDADKLLDRETGRRFALREAVRFLAEVSGADDVPRLVGKVKALDDLASLGGEHMADSVIVGDNAYSVQQGFVGTLLDEARASARSAPAVAPVSAPEPPPVVQPSPAPAPAPVPSPVPAAAKPSSASTPAVDPAAEKPDANSQTIVALRKLFLNNVK